MDGWSLRPCVEGDLKKIWGPYSSTRDAWKFDQLSIELEKSTTSFWVMTDDETDQEIAGFIIFSVVGDVCELMNIWVDPARRQQGVATGMIEAMIREAFRAEAEKVWLEVAKSNTQAVRLYQKLNFSITRIRKNYYQSGDDAFEMELSGAF